MKVPLELKQKVQLFCTLKRDLYKVLDILINYLRLAKINKELLWSEMNIWEKYLNGWPFGQKEKISSYKEMKKTIDAMHKQIEAINKNISQADSSIHSSVTTYLEQNDELYKVLIQTFDIHSDMKKAVEEQLAHIDNTLSSIGNAQSMESLDLVTTNKGISIMSFSGNLSANASIEALQEQTKSFQKKLNAYKSFLSSFDAKRVTVQIDDGLDLMFDLLFDSFDFMSFCTLAALGDAADQVSELRSQTERVEEIVFKNFFKAKEVNEQYVKLALRSCIENNN